MDYLKHIQMLEEHLRMIRHSRSWRWTYPARRLLEILGINLKYPVPPLNLYVGTNLIKTKLYHLIERTYNRFEASRIESLMDELLVSIKFAKQPFAKSRNHDYFFQRSRFIGSIGCNYPVENPEVSIIVPVFNQLNHTLACLISILESRPNLTYEIIIADDSSFDETKVTIPEIFDGVQVVSTPSNYGFLRNCNYAAKFAKGDYIVFLNNDVIVLPGWLEALVGSLKSDPMCGMVGSKLLNPDGSLQEAGGIVWKDGSAWNLGRNEDSEKPEYNYRKEVDYCSGASICLKKEVWEQLGGFDEYYAPAYYEETDLAFRLREKGLKTIYQPQSVGIHLEGITCGTDINSGIKSCQLINHNKFKKRWNNTLKKSHFPNGTNASAFCRPLHPQSR